MLRKIFLRSITLGGLVVAVIWLTASSVNPVEAISYGGVSIKPAGPDTSGLARRSFHFLAAEGTEIKDKIQITNGSSDQATLFVFGSAQNLENNQLEEVPVNPTNAGDPTRWITWDTNEINLPPQGSKEIGFTVKVPNNADVGDHIGALLASIKTVATKNRGQSGLTVVTQVGVQMTLVVPGDIVRDLKINKITHHVSRDQALGFLFNLTNSGNVSLAPKLDSKIRGWFGQVGQQLAGELDSIARGQTVNLSYGWIKRAPYFGRFVANFDFHLGEREQNNKDGTTTLLPDKIISARYVFWIIPWLQLFYLLVFVFVLYLLRSFWLYWLVVNRLRTKTSTYIVVAGDTITKIGAKLGTDPRILAKFNLMRWPYEVHSGDILLIPAGRYTGAEWRIRHLSILSSKEFISGILGHLFRWSSKAHQIADRVISKTKPQTHQHDRDVVIVERGDTIKDVADFANTTVTAIAKLNDLQPPYRLRLGQQLYIPKTKSTLKRKKKR